MKMVTALATALCISLAGCARAPKQSLTERDCQVEAAGGSLQTEVSTVFEAEAQGRTGGVTVRNTDACKGMVRAFTRTPTGTVACVGEDDAWCEAALNAQPVSMTPAQLAEMLRQARENDFETPPPE